MARRHKNAQQPTPSLASTCVAWCKTNPAKTVGTFLLACLLALWTHSLGLRTVEVSAKVELRKDSTKQTCATLKSASELVSKWDNMARVAATDGIPRLRRINEAEGTSATQGYAETAATLLPYTSKLETAHSSFLSFAELSREGPTPEGKLRHNPKMDFAARARYLLSVMDEATSDAATKASKCLSTDFSDA